MEEKKKREGKWQEPKMTPKQKEAFNIQLEKENIIKNRLQALSDQLEPYLILFKHSLQGQPKAFASIICKSKFLSTLHKVLQCPLFSDLMGQIWMELRKTVFDSVEDDSLSQIIMASTMTIIQDQGSKNKSLMESVIFKIEFIFTEKSIFLFYICFLGGLY